MTQRERQILQLIEANPMISQQELAEKLGITRSSVAVHISNLMKKGCIAGKGYVLPSSAYAVVVGGINVDIGGRSFAPLIPADSNPGLVTTSLGGVGRNIAHNMRLLGLDVRLLTAYGDDLHGQQAAAVCSQQGIDLSHALQVPGGVTSTYLYLAAPDGEMVLAVSDMAICEQITPAYLAANRTVLDRAQVVAADANIPQESLIYLADTLTVPLFVDPVSTAKAEKLRPILSKIHTLKPNRLEAELLSGVPIHSREDAGKAADALLGMGLHRLFLSLGAEGVLAAMGDQRLWLPTIPGHLVNTTGCGDAFMAALVWAYLEGCSLETTARAGLAAGSIAMESPETINPALSAHTLRARMGRQPNRKEADGL